MALLLSPDSPLSGSFSQVYKCSFCSRRLFQIVGNERSSAMAGRVGTAGRPSFGAIPENTTSRPVSCNVPYRSVINIWYLRPGGPQRVPASRRRLCHLRRRRGGRARQVAGALQRADGHHLRPAADGDLVARELAEIGSGALDQILGDDELAIIFLGGGFEAARRVDRIAHGGERDRLAVADLADDGRAAMEADADLERRFQIVGKRPVELDEALRHEARRGQRLAAAGFGPAPDAEKGHDAVADEFVDMPARRLDGFAHGGEIAVEDEDDVVGQARFGELGEGAEIGEENGDLALAALEVAGPGEAVARLRQRRQERRHANVAPGPELAGEAHARPRLDAAQHLRLL